MTNFVQMLDSSCWQFVVHGQGAVKQMGLVSPGFNLHLWQFHRKLKEPGQLLVQDSRLVRDLSENSKLFGGRLSRSKICQISQDAMGSDSCCLSAWLRLLMKRELIELLFAFFSPTCYLRWKQKKCFVMLML